MASKNAYACIFVVSAIARHGNWELLFVVSNHETALTIAGKINVTPKGVRLSEKLQLTAALCNEIWLQ